MNENQCTPQEKEAVVKPLKSKVNCKNNYQFNNCTVTINEEGKVIDILASKEKQIETVLQMAKPIINFLACFSESYFKKKEENKQSPQPAPVEKKPEVKKTNSKTGKK